MGLFSDPAGFFVFSPLSGRAERKRRFWFRLWTFEREKEKCVDEVFSSCKWKENCSIDLFFFSWYLVEKGC